MRTTRRLLCCALLLLPALTAHAQAAESDTAKLQLFADRDDDDADGVADGREDELIGASATDVHWLETAHRHVGAP
ncbi:MAG TPA: hypothetical protein VGP93_12400, partial [Polyangiaceae bacterium]|nr:hypothetical protein [Polyangiaceae bacterium]